MAKQIWAPEDGDEVLLKDGRTGKVSDLSSDPESTDGEGEWKFTVTFSGDEEEDDEEIEATYSEVRKRWEE